MVPVQCPRCPRCVLAALDVSLLPQTCPPAWCLLKGECYVLGILIPMEPCRTGVGTPSSPSARYCCPKTCYSPKSPSLGTEGKSLAHPYPLGHALAGRSQWVTRSLHPRAQVGSSKRQLQQGQSTSSEEHTATPTLRLPCLPSTTRALTSHCCSRPAPAPCARAPTPCRSCTPRVRCSRQPPPAQAELDDGVPPWVHPSPPPRPSPRLVLWGRAKQRSGDRGIWASLYFNKIVCSGSSIYTWERRGIYMTQWGYIQGSRRLGKGGAAALQPALVNGSVPAGAPVSDPP